MRTFAVLMALVLLLAVSLAIAWVASDWPHWCRFMGWCDGRGLL